MYVKGAKRLGSEKYCLLCFKKADTKSSIISIEDLPEFVKRYARLWKNSPKNIIIVFPMPTELTEVDVKAIPIAKKYIKTNGGGYDDRGYWYIPLSEGKGWHEPADYTGKAPMHVQALTRAVTKDILRQPSYKPTLTEVYHGTHADIIKFVRYDRIPNEYRPIGQYPFGTNLTDSKQFAKQFGKKIVTAYVDSNKLLDLTRVKNFYDLVDLLQINRKKYEFELKRMNANSYYYKIEPPYSFYRPLENLIHEFKLRSVLKKKGYKGLIFNDWENGVTGKSYVIFDPENIQVGRIEIVQ